MKFLSYIAFAALTAFAANSLLDVGTGSIAAAQERTIAAIEAAE